MSEECRGDGKDLEEVVMSLMPWGPRLSCPENRRSWYTGSCANFITGTAASSLSTSPLSQISQSGMRCHASPCTPFPTQPPTPLCPSHRHRAAERSRAEEKRWPDSQRYSRDPSGGNDSLLSLISGMARKVVVLVYNVPRVMFGDQCKLGDELCHLTSVSLIYRRGGDMG